MGNLERWVEGQNLRLFQTLNCDLSFGLGYGSWRVSHGSFLESVGTFETQPYWEGRGVSMGVSGADLVGLGSF